jgi:hypothetical protein
MLGRLIRNSKSMFNARSRNQRSAFWQRTALVMAFVCCVMCSYGTIAHHDDALYGVSQSSTVSISHATPMPPAGECAACEWTSAIQITPVYAVEAPTPRFTTLDIPSYPVQHLAWTSIRLQPQRGPPSSLVS